jgi:RNA polymerase sigma-70 factor, ECF subfamily
MVANLQNLKAPTEADFHQAISACSGRWYSACLKITRDPELAADAVQDALLNAWQKRHQFDNAARLETWIHRIVINAALQRLRKLRPGVLQSLGTEIPDSSNTPHGAHADSVIHASLSAALAGLTDIERVCFVLKHLEEWRLSEIAGELGTNVGAVKQAVFRAVRKLRVDLSTLRSEPA